MSDCLQFFRRVVAFDNCKDKRSFDRWYAREFGTDDPHAMERWAEEEAGALTALMLLLLLMDS